MAVPFASRRNYGDDNLQLYFPSLITSPAIPQAGDTYLSDVRIKDMDIKSIYLEKGTSEPNLSWDGNRYDWAKNITEIQTDFIDGGGTSGSSFNLLENTSLSTGSISKWIGVYEVPYVEGSSDKEQVANWIFAEEAPAGAGLIWVPLSGDNKYEPMIEMGSAKYYDTKQKVFGGSIKLEEDMSSRHHFHIEKTRQNYLTGVSQMVELQYHLWKNEKITVGFDMKETDKSGGAIIRVELFDQNYKLLQTSFSPRFFNKSSAKKRFSSTFIYTKNEGVKNMRVSILGVPDRAGDLYIDKIKAELGDRDTGWNLHEEEVLMNLNAGEINLPVLNGELDKSKLISEIAILRSTLGEGLLKWEEVTRLKSSSMQEAVLYDYFVENGNYYRYALQPILANGMKGAITEFYDTVTTFDGFWLLGEEDYQFSFIYNGVIGEISHVKPVDIIETIGGKYPYIVRSSELDYRRYQFSGTLTSHQDVLGLFASENYSVAISPDPTVPISYVELKYGDEKLLNCKNDLEEMQDGMVMQRLWRDKISKWLNDGEPKIMKSEAQGNMLVHLSNVSITPNETLAGLISDFSCTVTEIGPLTEKSLQKYKLRKKVVTKDELVKESAKDSII